MLRYALQRLALTAPSLLGVITLAFLLIHLVPGDPVDQMLGEQAAAADKAALRQELGLDRPLLEQYGNYLLKLATLDLGDSLTSRKPVAADLAERLPATAELSLTAMFLALCWALPLGIWSKVKGWDRSAETLALLAMSFPAVFLGPALVYIFALKLDLFPVSERGGLENLILPAVSLALPLGAVILRMTRAALADVLVQDYIRTAHAKGLPGETVYFKHALRNVMIPLTTVVSLQLGALLTGTVITETIFDWPGIGTMLLNAIQRRDYPVVQSCILLIAFIYITVNFLTDLLYAIFDPRIRLGDR